MKGWLTWASPNREGQEGRLKQHLRGGSTSGVRGGGEVATMTTVSGRNAAQTMILCKTVLQIPVAGLTLCYLLRLEDVYGCPYDVIEVFDGRQVASLSMGRFCAGEELTFLSSSNIMTIVFRSDAMITNKGFYALYNGLHQDGRESGRYPHTYVEGI